MMSLLDAILATVNSNTDEMKAAKKQLKEMQQTLCSMAYGASNKELKNDLLRLADRITDVLEEHFTYTV